MAAVQVIERDHGLVAGREDFAPGEPLERGYETHTTPAPKIGADGVRPASCRLD
jgi:hypothetical protein